MKQPGLASIGARREPFSKGEKLLFSTLPLVLVGFALSGWWLAQVDVTPQIQFPSPSALPSPNGFDFYVAAAGAIRSSVPAVDPIDDPRGVLATNPKLAAQSYSLSRRQAWLRANSAGFALFQQALAMSSRFPDATGRASYGLLRQLARDKVIEANTLILQKRWHAATICSLDTIQMGNDVARGGPLIAKMVGTAIVAIGRNPLANSQMVPEKLGAPQAKAAARRLEAILSTRPTYEAALKNDKWVMLSDFIGSVRAGNWRALAAQNNPEMSWRKRMSLQFLTPGEVTKRIAERCDQSVRDVQKPFNVTLAPASSLDPVTELFAYSGDYRFNEGRELVGLDVLTVRFALRAYRLENGRFPTTLKQLSPRYLKQIPTDYFASGAPFGYKISGSNYVLWSVGPDKIDNGGVQIAPRTGQRGIDLFGQFPLIFNDSTGDYVAGKNG